MSDFQLNLSRQSWFKYIFVFGLYTWNIEILDINLCTMQCVQKQNGILPDKMLDVENTVFVGHVDLIRLWQVDRQPLLLCMLQHQAASCHSTYHITQLSITLVDGVCFSSKDYACQIFHDALVHGHHRCYLKADTRLPMMYIEDCLRSVTEFMEVPTQQLKMRTYNVHAMSFTPEELVEEVRRYIPRLTVEYVPDERQDIGRLKYLTKCML